MLLCEVAAKLNLDPVNHPGNDLQVKNGYASDLLSDVLARAGDGTLWVTNQKHQNVIGVAVMLDFAGVIIAGGVEPDANTIANAVEEGVALYRTGLSLYEVAGRMYEIGIPPVAAR
jgi:hypothetical protein